MESQEILEVLRLGRRNGANALWLGGGEPTLYASLGGIVAKARAIGYRTIRLQTNGLRLAHRDYAEHLVGRGITDVAVSLVAAEASSFDRFTQVDGAFDFVVRALGNLSVLGVTLEADVLVTSANMHELVDIVHTFAGQGIRRFWFWLVSLHGIEARQLAGLVPKLADAGRCIAAACDAADELEIEAWSLHTPPCALPVRHRNRYRHAGNWRLLVATPGGNRFMAEESPMEGGTFLPNCAACVARHDCLGLRADYLAVHGEDGIVGLTS